MRLNSLVFEILLSLSDQPRHGYTLVGEVEQRLGGERIMPANFYRTLRTMLADGLIEEVARPKSADGDNERRRYFKATKAGNDAARREARRLESLVAESRTRKLLPVKR
jgi:DNA-binding PadR family transcriptional regulator